MYKDSNLSSCREGDSSIFTPFKKGFVDVFASPDTFIFLHKGIQKIKTNSFKPSYSNLDTLITNYLKGKDKIIQWNMKPHLECNYIFLENNERNALAKQHHEILIDQLYHRRFYFDKVGAYNFKLHLNMFHPTTIFVFVPKRSDAANRNAWSNYTNWVDVHQDPFTDASISALTINRDNWPLYKKGIISNIKILFIMDRMVDEKDETYFTHLQKYQHNFSFDVCDIPIYSFNLDSKINKPNGAVNMSQLKDISMNIETLPVFSKDCHYILDLYAVQYNQLEILNGIGGIKWGN